ARGAGRHTARRVEARAREARRGGARDTRGAHHAPAALAAPRPALVRGPAVHLRREVGAAAAVAHASGRKGGLTRLAAVVRDRESPAELIVSGYLAGRVADRLERPDRAVVVGEVPRGLRRAVIAGHQ